MDLPSPHAPAPDLDLTSPDPYINRELSLLEFHRRVFEQAQDRATPLLERLKFLCITSSILDEFFEVRVAGLKEQAHLGAATKAADGLSSAEALARISAIGHELVDAQYRYLNEVMLPELAAEGIRFLKRDEWSEAEAAWIRGYFQSELLPILSPIRLDPAHPFPRILNKSLNFIVSLEGKDAFGRPAEMAIVQAPRALPRLIRIPAQVAERPHDFVFLSSIIHAFVDEIFPGLKITGCYQFRVTRNSDLWVDPEEVDDLLRAMEGELLHRRYGHPVRLEVADNCPPAAREFLLKRFELGPDDLYQVNGPVNLHRLMAVPDQVDHPDLKYPPFSPGVPKELRTGADLFAEIARGDILLHHPYESFAPVIDLLRQAGSDPRVLAIKQTLYRTGSDSVLVDLLEAAARAGKEVTVVIELRARFDEAQNIELANRLQEAGAHVVYGVVGYKTHAKMLLVVRREDDHLRRYVHLGTGNYHARTARLYTDYGLLSADPALGEDVHHVFMQLTASGRGARLRKLLQSPFTLHLGLIERIQREAEHARAGKPARIIGKMNALVEPEIIRALYAASRAGVAIDLIVRGICCLRPGVPGLSETIRVISIVGRFLEHSRAFYFANAGVPEVFAGSADWMPRNLFHRVETVFPIESPRLKQRLLADLELCLRDNTQARQMRADGTYVRLDPAGAEPVTAQHALLTALAET